MDFSVNENNIEQNPATTDRAILDAVGLGASLLLAWGNLHLAVLASRSALLGLAHTSIVVAATMAFVCLFFRGRSQTNLKRVGSILLVVAGVLAVAFAFATDPGARGILFVFQQTCAGGALACWTSRVIAQDGLRQQLTACGSGCAGAGVLGIALYGIASSLGLASNVASYTTLAMVVYGLAAVAAGIVTCIWKPDDDREKRTDVREGGSRAYNRPAAGAQLAMFAAVCLAGVAVWFFDGITFNPYVHDMLAILLVANLTCAVGGILLIACARLSDSDRLSSLVFGCIALFLGVAILGIALVSTSLEGPGFTIGIVEGSSVLLLCAGIAHMSMAGRTGARFAEAVLLCCSAPWAMQLGLAVKRSVGYSLATITPIVLVAIALLSIVSLVLNAQSARNVSMMQQGYEDEISRQQLDFAVERDAAKKRAERQIERERQARERAVEAARREISDRSPKTVTADRFAEVLGNLGLTSRECEVAMLAVQGRTIEGIGSELGIAKQTVNYHLHNIYAKLDVEGKNEMVTRVYAAVNERDETDE